MPNQPRPSNGNRTLRFEDDLWAAFARVCDELGVSRNQRLIHHMQADVADEGWEPGRWWRVMRDGEVWAETSSETDARARLEPGDVLWREWRRVDEEWREEAQADVDQHQTSQEDK